MTLAGYVELMTNGNKNLLQNDWHTVMCFNSVHNFTKSNIKQYHMPVIAATYDVLISPYSTSEQPTQEHQFARYKQVLLSSFLSMR